MEFIFDRNISDISYAKSLIQKIKDSGFTSLDETELYHWTAGLKGTLNYTDLNRIEENCKMLLGLFGLPRDTKVNWSATEFPKKEDFDRILSNVTQIRRQGYINNLTPYVPQHPINHYQKLNDIEEILFVTHTTAGANVANADFVDEVFIDDEIGVI